MKNRSEDSGYIFNLCYFELSFEPTFFLDNHVKYKKKSYEQSSESFPQSGLLFAMKCVST